jgi:hypothetical protein
VEQAELAPSTPAVVAPAGPQVAQLLERDRANSLPGVTKLATWVITDSSESGAKKHRKEKKHRRPHDAESSSSNSRPESPRMHRSPGRLAHSLLTEPVRPSGSPKSQSAASTSPKEGALPSAEQSHASSPKSASSPKHSPTLQGSSGHSPKGVAPDSVQPPRRPHSKPELLPPAHSLAASPLSVRLLSTRSS